MNRKYTRTLEFESDKILTVSGLRSLIEWLDHIGLREDQAVFIRADDNQKDGYWFRAHVEIDDTPKDLKS